MEQTQEQDTLSPHSGLEQLKSPDLLLIAKRRIISEDQDWNLALVDKLSEMCIRVIVTNFESEAANLTLGSPLLKGLPLKYRPLVIAGISTDLPLNIAGPLIPDPEYWKRRAKSKFKLASVRDHGHSWKRLFFELHIQNQIESFVPSRDSVTMEARLKALHFQLAISSPFIQCLTLRQLQPIASKNQSDEKKRDILDTSIYFSAPLDHLEIGHVLPELGYLQELNIYYGVLNCGMNYTSSYFGMTESDSASLATCIALDMIQKLTVQASFIDDAKCNLLCSALLNNKSMTYLG